MNLSIRLKATKIIFLLTIVGAIGSFVTGSLYLGNIYPFFHWKLYSQPLGSNNTFTEYRIYSRQKDSQSFRRISIHEQSDFNLDEYVYTLNFLVSGTLNDSLQQTDFRKRLFTFVSHVDPDKTSYKIVSETYHPKEIFYDPARYDTATIINF